DPARNLDLRRRAGSHSRDRTARAVRPSTDSWDWGRGETDGSLALDLHELWADTRPGHVSQLSQSRLKAGATSATVAAMQPLAASRRPPRRSASAARHSRR